MSFASTDFALNAGPLIPVLALHDNADLLPLTQALVKGGIQVFELVLRLPTALQAIARLRDEVPILGAGTVLNADQMAAAKQAGAKFCVSPGLTSALHKAALDLQMPLLPGAVTASEIMTARELGYKNLKFFPAERAGGPKALEDFGTVFPGLRFCPTGGVNTDNVSAYRSLKNVACVGGSFATPKALIQAKDWAGLTTHVRDLLDSM